MFIGLHVKYPLDCQILTKLEFSRQVTKNTQICNGAWGSIVVKALRY
jgi:hypothetical protein